MRKFLFSCLILYLLISGVRSCSSSSNPRKEKVIDSPVVDTPQIDTSRLPIINNVKQAEMTVYTEDNVKITIPVDGETLYCTMASWCPFSKKIMTLVNDPHYDVITKKYKIVFLYDKDEIDHFRKKINNDAEAEGMTKAEVEQMNKVLRQREQEGKLVMPEVLSDIPMDVKYFYFSYNNFEFHTGGYPSTYNSQTSGFDIKPFDWWYRKSPNDKLLLLEMYDFYIQDDKNKNQ